MKRLFIIFLVFTICFSLFANYEEYSSVYIQQIITDFTSFGGNKFEHPNIVIDCVATNSADEMLEGRLVISPTADNSSECKYPFDGFQYFIGVSINEASTNSVLKIGKITEVTVGFLDKNTSELESLLTFEKYEWKQADTSASVTFFLSPKDQNILLQLMNNNNLICLFNFKCDTNDYSAIINISEDNSLERTIIATKKLF